VACSFEVSLDTIPPGAPGTLNPGMTAANLSPAASVVDALGSDNSVAGLFVLDAKLPTDARALPDPLVIAPADIMALVDDAAFCNPPAPVLTFNVCTADPIRFCA